MNKIDMIKQCNDLEAYIRACGVKLTRHGRNDLKGLCPFHDDKNPSLIVSPKKQLFNCPVCNVGGSVIDFAARYHKITVAEAIKWLSGEANEDNFSAKREKDLKPETVNLTPERSNELLERAVSFYEKTFSNVPEGKKYLEERGITDAGLFSKHRIGYADGSLLKALPKDGKIIDDLKTLGMLLDNGSERYKGCVVFPVFDVEGNIVTLYGRSLNGRKHLYLPNRPTGLFNISVAKTYPEIVLVESCIDALSLEMAGINNVISIQSTNGLNEASIALLAGCEVRKIALLLDGDKAGQDASFKLLKELSDHFEVTSIRLPEDHDPNSYLQEFGAEKLQSLFADPLTREEDNVKSANFANGEDCTRKIDGGFAVNCGLRRYEALGLEKKHRNLKATIRVEKSGKLHVDTIDFYSSRQRRQLSQDLCNVFDELPDTINADIAKILKMCESQGDKKSANFAKSDEATEERELVLTPEETKEALSFAKSPNIIEEIEKQYEICGLIGEESNKLLCYLAMTSRKMQEPLSVLILSSSGAGKTALQDTALSFCPPEDLVKLTSLSAKALFYKEQTSLKHKVLAIEEGAGAEDASYAIRNLISSDGLTSEVAIRDPQTGQLTTMANTVEGPVAVFCTTTDPDVDPETKSRFLVTGIDESREQTRRILDFQKQRHSIEGLQVNLERDKVLKIHRNFQRLLKPLAVVNPHLEKLTFSDDRLQGRRAQPQYLNIINAVAFLRQFQKEIRKYTAEKKEVEYIEVDEFDIETGNKLAVEILGKTLDELSIPARDLLDLIDKMLSAKLAEIIKKEGKETSTFKRDLTFTRRELREFSGWTNTRLHNHIKELVSMEYVVMENARFNNMQTYKLIYNGEGKDGKKFIM